MEAYHFADAKTRATHLQIYVTTSLVLILLYGYAVTYRLPLWIDHFRAWKQERARQRGESRVYSTNMGTCVGEDGTIGLDSRGSLIREHVNHLTEENYEGEECDMPVDSPLLLSTTARSAPPPLPSRAWTFDQITMLRAGSREEVFTPQPPQPDRCARE